MDNGRRSYVHTSPSTSAAPSIRPHTLASSRAQSIASPEASIRWRLRDGQSALFQAGTAITLILRRKLRMRVL
jgi:hypothetical protein